MKNLFISLIIIMFAAPIVALADGLTDFNTKCAACHGGNAKTNARRAIMLKIDPKKLYLSKSEMNRDEMIGIIEKGKDKMPSFEKSLTMEQITAIVDYVLSLSTNK